MKNLENSLRKLENSLRGSKSHGKESRLISFRCPKGLSEAIRKLQIEHDVNQSTIIIELLKTHPRLHLWPSS